MRTTRFIGALALPALMGFASVWFTSCAPPPPKEEPGLKEAFADFFEIGTAFNTRQILGQDSMARVLAAKHFNAMTAENAMKWEFIQPYPNQFDFTLADSLVDFAERHGMSMVGHVLVWHSQVPDWVFEDAQGNPISRDSLIARMRHHIHTVVGRYRGRVDAWDVVNEALNEDGSFRQTKWYRIIGEEYIPMAFRFAHEADPEAKLFYNDFNLAYPAKRAGAVRLVSGLLAQGVPIHAIGEQGHYHLHTPTIEEVEGTLQAFAALGLPVFITELDINVLPFPFDMIGADVQLTAERRKELDPFTQGLPDSISDRFTQRYLDLFRLFLKYSDNIERVSLWGVHDGQSWLNYWPVRGRVNYPLLFDRSYQAKPVVAKLIQMAQEERAKQQAPAAPQ